jgi:RNA polymerase sigma-70 factor (ECF subfamily)
MEGAVTIAAAERFIDMSEAFGSAAPGDPRPALERAHPATGSLEATLAEIYEERRGELFAFLLRMTRDPDTAEDLLQDAFIRLIREARAGRMPDQVRPWLYRVAANAAISRSRRGAALGRLLPRLLDRRDPPRPESEILRSERAAELHAALAHLRSAERAALLLAAQGFNGHEIAAMIERSDGATRTLMCRARVQLRSLVEAGEERP